MKIFIDAGHNHSGWNTGAVGNGMREQDITFEVAARLGRILENAGLQVRLSRPTLETNLGTDNNSSINTRWQMSNAWGADYFISIHVNAGGGTGAETLYFKPNSLEFAQVMQDVYSGQMGLRNRRVWHRDNVGVLRWTNCPAILLELAFIDAPPSAPDLDILRNRRPEMAAAAAQGVFAYLGINPGKDEPADPVRFNKIEELPTWAQPTIKKLVERGFLQGDGNGLDLSLEMARVFVVHDRAGVYD
ncbi:MAG: N-acetylmuramoyl-L-alanine amidase [Defluviitaleaceae bacterium]|nr:N-acetylmuramoyl-L-alanine amidase [Defluviitaleaceae bacterium]